MLKKQFYGRGQEKLQLLGVQVPWEYGKTCQGGT